jgi:hypothetical protein
MATDTSLDMGTDDMGEKLTLDKIEKMPVAIKHLPNGSHYLIFAAVKAL